MDTQETGPAAGVDAPDNGPVTLRDIVAAVKADTRATQARYERRKLRDDLIRRGLASGLVTQAQMARETGLSEQQISRIKEGQTSGRVRSK